MSDKFLNEVVELALKEKDKGVHWLEVVKLRNRYGIGRKTCKKVINKTSRLVKFEESSGKWRLFANQMYLEQWGEKHGIKPKPQDMDKRQGKIVARNSRNEKYSHVIYRFVDFNGNVIYIGRAKHLENRLNSHGHLPKECYKEIASIHYTKFSTEDDLDLAEPYYISKFKPQYNKDFKNKRYSIKIDYLENKKWKNYDTFKIL